MVFVESDDKHHFSPMLSGFPLLQDKDRTRSDSVLGPKKMLSLLGALEAGKTPEGLDVSTLFLLSALLGLSVELC